MKFYMWKCDFSGCLCMTTQEYHDTMLRRKERYGAVNCKTPNCPGELEPYATVEGNLL